MAERPGERGPPGGARPASGCRTLSLAASRAASPASTACLARAMSASTCGSSTAVGTGKSDRCTELPSERLRYMASETKGANGAISPDTVRRASYRVWYAAALSRSDCDFQKRLRDRRMYQLERSST